MLQIHSRLVISKDIDDFFTQLIATDVIREIKYIINTHYNYAVASSSTDTVLHTFTTTFIYTRMSSY